MLALRNPLESGLKAISPHAVNFSEAAGRLPNTTLFAVEGMKAETARRGAREPGLEHRRGRYRTLSCRLEKACKCAM